MIQKNINKNKDNPFCKYHTNIYLTEDGKETEVTYIKDDDHPHRFQDSIYRGKIVKWLRPCYI